MKNSPAGVRVKSSRECIRWLVRPGLALFLALIWSGCSTPVGPARHLVVIDKGGTPLDASTDRYRPLNSSSYTNYLTNLFQGMTDYAKARLTNRLSATNQPGSNAVAKPNQLVIFIHGGLNSLEGGVERAVKLTATITNDDVYPIFVSWDSSLLGSWWEHTVWVRRGNTNYGCLAPWLSPFYFAADVGNGILKSPIVFIEGLWRTGEALPCWPPNEAIRNSLCAASNLNAEFHSPNITNRTNAIAVDLGTNQLTWFGNAKQGTYTIFNLPMRAALGPFFHSFGTPSWNVMLRRVNLLFEPESDSHAGHGNFVEPPGALTVFAHELGRYLEHQTNRWEITLVGHSMGAIVAAEFLERAQIYSNFPPVDNIVLMAPAGSQRQFENAVLPYMRQHSNTLCSVLTLERRGELWERYWHVAPQGSLLVWVDDYFANPNSEVDQTLGRFPNLMLGAHRIPPEVRGRMNFRAFSFPSPDRKEEPQTHGDFSRTNFWKREFWDVRSR